MSQQGKRQASIRALTGKALDHNGDWHALFDLDGIPAGAFNGRLLAWLNVQLSQPRADLMGAQAAYAAMQGASTWGGLSQIVRGSLTIPDQTNYTVGSYLAYASPWGAIAAGKIQGTDYSDSITVSPSAFPNNTVINWNQPATTAPSVWGYFFVSHGQYDGGAPQTPITVQQAKDVRLSVSHDVTLGGTVANYNVLAECYLYTASNLTTKSVEIGAYLHAPTDTATYHNGGTTVGSGTYTDASGRAWTVRQHLDGAAGKFITFMPSADVLSGTIEWTGFFAYLQTAGAITGTEYYGGIALGAEPYRGSGSLTVTTFQADYATKTNLITNGTFDANNDAGWTNLWFLGKSVSNNALTYASTPANENVFHACPLVAGRTYTLTHTIATFSAGGVQARLSGGGTTRVGIDRTAAGTYTETLVANTGNTQLELFCTGASNTYTIDNVSLVG